jgi:hypothetical protein
MRVPRATGFVVLIVAQRLLSKNLSAGDRRALGVIALAAHLL